MWSTPPFPAGAVNVTGMLHGAPVTDPAHGFRLWVSSLERSGPGTWGYRTCRHPPALARTCRHLSAPARTRYSTVAGRNHRDGRN